MLVRAGASIRRLRAAQCRWLSPGRESSGRIPSLATKKEAAEFLHNVRINGGGRPELMQFMRLIAFERQFSVELSDEIAEHQDWILEHLAHVSDPAHILGFLGGLASGVFPDAELPEELAHAFFCKAAEVLPNLEKNSPGFRLVSMFAPALHRLRYYHEPFLDALSAWVKEAIEHHNFPLSVRQATAVAHCFASADYVDPISVQSLMKRALPWTRAEDLNITLETVIDLVWCCVHHGIGIAGPTFFKLVHKLRLYANCSFSLTLDQLDKVQLIYALAMQSHNDPLIRREFQNLAHARQCVELDLEHQQRRIISVYPNIEVNQKAVAEKPLLAHMDPITGRPSPQKVESTTPVALFLPRKARVMRPGIRYDGVMAYQIKLMQRNFSLVHSLPAGEIRNLPVIDAAAKCVKAMQAAL